MPQSPPAGDPFGALGDANRREILSLLRDGGRSVRQIAAALPISRPAVSRHLRLLKDAGLVSEEPRGTRRIYRLRGEGIHAVQAYLESVWGEAAARFRLLSENTERVAPTHPAHTHPAHTHPSHTENTERAGRAQGGPSQ